MNKVAEIIAEWKEKQMLESSKKLLAYVRENLGTWEHINGDEWTIQEVGSYPPEFEWGFTVRDGTRTNPRTRTKGDLWEAKDTLKYVVDTDSFRRKDRSTVSYHTSTEEINKFLAWAENNT